MPFAAAGSVEVSRKLTKADVNDINNGQPDPQQIEFHILIDDV